MSTYHTQVVVVGGGIAGLWTLHALRQAGYQAVLLESEKLGGGQTLAAQGILHGGMKYALDGKVDDIAMRLRDMPGRWLACMGEKWQPGAEADLRSVAVLSPHQYLFSDGGLLSRAAAAVGSKLMSGAAEAVATAEIPDLIKKCQPVRLLKETIIDTKSAITALATPHAAVIYHAPAAETAWETNKDGLAAAVIRGTTRLTADAWVFAAGAGNELPAGLLPFSQPATQRRPLRQVMVKGVPTAFYGHCVAADPKPRFTITSHRHADGSLVWYLGGNVAEKGATLTDDETIAFARKELQAVFPNIDWTKMLYATWAGDRAEPKQTSRFMPAEPTTIRSGNCLLAWPTKLVFAPGLASRVLAELRHVQLEPNGEPSLDLPLEKAPLGEYPWEAADWR